MEILYVYGMDFVKERKYVIHSKKKKEKEIVNLLLTLFAPSLSSLVPDISRYSPLL